MKSYLIIGDPIPADCFDDTPYPLSTLAENLKKRLSAAKSLLDTPYKDPRYRKVANILDYYRSLRYIVALKYNAQNVSNAWLKMYELTSFYKLVDAKTGSYFGNAEMPGSFLLAFNHYVRTHGFHPKWFASSIIAEDAQKNYLEDRYSLHRNYPANWLMDKTNNGDITSWANIDDFRKKIVAKNDGKLVDLYTSDAGVDVSEDYNEQERLEAKIHLGSTLSGLATLAKGGRMVLKTFTYFEPFSLSLIRILATMFDKFHICKPLTSRPSNSEVYLVGIGYRGMDDKIQTVLSKRLANFNFQPFLSAKCVYGDKPFMEAIQKSYEIFENQITVLRENIDFYNKYRDDIPGLVDAYKNRKSIMINKYLKDYPLKYIDNKDKLKATEEITRNKK